MARLPRWPACQGEPALSARCFKQLGQVTDIPWHRVVNAKGEVSYALSRNGGDALQQRLLEKEGVEFDNRNRFDLERFRWPE
jgi:methylated-DNA-protein-cysteine methyltransferase-like protein